MARVEQRLALELRHGAIVVMAHLGSHKVRSVVHATERTGAQLCYPAPYNPNFDPIAQSFAKLKEMLRSTAVRMVQLLWDAIGTLLEEFSPSECTN